LVEMSWAWVQPAVVFEQGSEPESVIRAPWK